MIQKRKHTSELKKKFKILRLSDYYNLVRDLKNPNQPLVQDSIDYIANHFEVVNIVEVKGETYFIAEA